MDVKKYILIYDNGESYEDHQTENLCIVSNKAVGQQIIEKCQKWVAKKRYKITDEPDIEDVDFFEKYQSKRDYIENLQPPYGFAILNRYVRDGGQPILDLAEIDEKTKS